MVSSRPSAGRLRARFRDREDLGRDGVSATSRSHLSAAHLSEFLDERANQSGCSDHAAKVLMAALRAGS